MPTILELFKSTGLDKQVKPDKDTVIEQELNGIRVRSAVELNNPLLYGNQSIRIATRSTSAVELMKQATGGDAADGGLIGQGLGAITGGGFGRFVFGGKVTSLNQARDGINSRLGIPQNPIPTFVNNTGELQTGIEPDTMITLAKIKNNASGTLLGKFLKQTGGGNPSTIGNQILGQGITLVKDKLRTTLFGNPAALGSNTAQPVNGGWEYSSQSTYSDQIRDAKLQEQSESKLAIDKANAEVIKKTTELKEDAKKKLGEAEGSLRNKLKGTSPTNNEQINAAIESQTKIKPSSDLPYSQTLGNYKTEPDGKLTRIDLSLVSPVYGVDRKDTKGKYGKSDYAFQDIKNTTGRYSPWTPQEKYTSKNNKNWESLYGITNGSDAISKSPVQQRTEEELKQIEKQDLIPFWIKSKRSNRTVHFRSYITGISETVSPSWNASKFYGNPFNFYTYEGVERGVQFTLSVACLNQLELASNWEKLEFLTQQTYPTFSESAETKTFAIPPIISFRLGNIYKDKIGFIESLSYSIPENNVWETNTDGLLLPKFIEVNITIKFIEQVGSQSVIYNIRRSGDAIQIINEQNSSQGGAFTTEAVSTNETPTKVDEFGVESTETNEGGINKKPTNLNSGQSEPTPSDSQTGEVVTSDNRTSAITSAYAERLKEVKNKLPNIEEFTAQAFAQDTRNKIDTIQKLAENAWYFQYEYVDGAFQDMVIELSPNGLTTSQYQYWVIYKNNGVDPLNKI